MANPIIHVEVIGQDAQKLHAFYGQAFGWEIHPAPQNYGMIHTGTERGIAGGIGQANQGAGHVTFYVEVGDINAALARIEKLGGKTLTPRTEIPDQVVFALFADPEGHTIGLTEAR
jgi:predicted enzyme related to lactoylglutathione lyase